MNEAMNHCKIKIQSEHIVYSAAPPHTSLPPASFTTQASNGGVHAIMFQCVVFTELLVRVCVCSFKPDAVLRCRCECCGVVVGHNNTTTTVCV